MKKIRFFAIIVFAVAFVILIFSFVKAAFRKKDEIKAFAAPLLEKYHLHEKMETGNILLVGEKGYSSIAKAVSRAKNGDVIIIRSGKYEESLHITDKTLYLIGESRSDCVLTYPNGNYFSPPIEMGSGMLANMTVYASHQEKEEEAIAKAYALHADFDISKNSKLEVVDIDFVNDSYQTVGIGLRENFTLIFRNCLFENKGNQNAFYCHDDPGQEVSSNQRLIVEECRFLNNAVDESTILLQSQEAIGSEILCEWKNNFVENLAGGKCLDVYLWREKAVSEPGWLGMSFWKNSNASGGNNLSELNQE